MTSNNAGSTKVSEMAMTATAKEAREREEFQSNLSKILEDDPKQTLFQK